jgi:hypothetical protein
MQKLFDHCKLPPPKYEENPQTTKLPRSVSFSPVKREYPILPSDSDSDSPENKPLPPFARHQGTVQTITKQLHPDVLAAMNKNPSAKINNLNIGAPVKNELHYDVPRNHSVPKQTSTDQQQLEKPTFSTTYSSDSE